MRPHRAVPKLALPKLALPKLALPKLALLAGAAAIGLGACGTNSGNTSPTVPPTSSSTAPPSGTGGNGAPSSTTTTTATASSTTTTAAAAESGPGRCMVSQLSVSSGRSNAGTGHIGQVFTFTNTSSATCTMYGYPGLGMLNSSGQAITTNVLRTPSVVVQPETPTTVSLAPGKQASFLLGYEDQTGFGNSTCPSSASLEITPPNDYSHLVVPAQIAAYGPSIGQCGAINVSPIYPGSGQQP
ncbi:MAG: DUF4232 domain-containing protein [Acidimicrobiales bacterium]